MGEAVSSRFSIEAKRLHLVGRPHRRRQNRKVGRRRQLFKRGKVQLPLVISRGRSCFVTQMTDTWACVNRISIKDILSYFICTWLPAGTRSYHSLRASLRPALVPTFPLILAQLRSEGNPTPRNSESPADGRRKYARLVSDQRVQQTSKPRHSVLSPISFSLIFILFCHFSFLFYTDLSCPEDRFLLNSSARQVTLASFRSSPLPPHPYLAGKR